MRMAGCGEPEGKLLRPSAGFSEFAEQRGTPAGLYTACCPPGQHLCAKLGLGLPTCVQQREHMRRHKEQAELLGIAYIQQALLC